MSDGQRNSVSRVNEYNKNHGYGLTFLTPKSLPDFTSFMPSVVCSPKENMCRTAVCHANKDVYRRI